MEMVNEVAKPYVIFVGDESSPVYTKTGAGIAHWNPDACVGQIRLSPDAADLGLPDMTLDDALAAGARTLVIGIAVVGGAIPATMRAVILDALNRGLDVASGTHDRLADDPEFAAAAASSGASITDIRVPPPGLPVGKGVKRQGEAIVDRGHGLCSGQEIHSSRSRERDVRSWNGRHFSGYRSNGNFDLW